LISIDLEAPPWGTELKLMTPPMEEEEHLR